MGWETQPLRMRPNATLTLLSESMFTRDPTPTDDDVKEIAI